MGSLVIPEKPQLVPPGFAAKVKAQLSSIRKIDEVDEARRRMASLRQYVTKREHKTELNSGERWCEVRIGELLGPGSGKGKYNRGDKSLASYLPPMDRFRFRLMAANRQLVGKMIAKGFVSRAQILAAIHAKTNGNGRMIETGICTDLSRLRGKTFGTIYADPPWRYGNQGTRAATDNHYETMTVDEIAAMPIQALAAKSAHLHLWTTNAFLFDSQKIMEAWGFTYKSVFIWVKPQMGIGNYWRVSHEFLLLGVRGDCAFLDRSQMSWLQDDRTEHSAKPVKVRRLVEKVSPGPRLELFGREPADGWIVYGNQIRKGLYDSEIRDV